MAKRKRSETLSLRVSADVKRQIEALAAFRGTSATRLLESMVNEAAAEPVIIPSEETRDLFEPEQRISITKALVASAHEEPEVARLRLYVIAPQALSDKDYRIASAIVENLDLFSGETPVFEELLIDEKVKARLGRRLAVSLDKIRHMEPALEEWHSFLLRNKGWKSGFDFFLVMSGYPTQ